MSNKVYVGNLPWSIRDEKLAEIFSEAGEVVSARVITDRATNRSKGFGFVEFASDDMAQAAIEKFNEFEIEGRALRVNEAQDKPRN